MMLVQVLHNPSIMKYGIVEEDTNLCRSYAGKHAHFVIIGPESQFQAEIPILRQITVSLGISLIQKHLRSVPRIRD